MGNHGRSDPLSPLAAIMDDWHEQIFNYFDCPFKESFTAALRNLAKGINRIGSGNNFEVIRARTLYGAYDSDDAEVGTNPAEKSAALPPPPATSENRIERF